VPQGRQGQTGWTTTREIIMSDTAMTPPLPGSFVWQELNTRDPQKARDFFAGLLGWTYKEWDMGPAGIYLLIEHGGKQIGGIMHMKGPEWGDMAPHWMTYVSVPDVDAAAARVTELGGTVCVPPTDIPSVGRFSVINDPSGATLSLITFAAAAPPPEA
jgi:uncharacterized protein